MFGVFRAACREVTVVEFDEHFGHCHHVNSYGEELLHELARRIPVASYLSADQQRELTQVTSKDTLVEFFAKIGFGDVSTDGEIPDVAASFVFNVRAKQAEKLLGGEGCLLMPFALQAYWLVDAWRMDNLRFGIAEILAFVALFAACLSYEVSIAPVFPGMPQQLLLALPVALLIGAFPSYIFKNARWVVVSFDVIVVMEAVAFVAWWRS